MAAVVRKFHYDSVNLLTQSAFRHTIPEGETWEIIEWSGVANNNADTHVCIIWDYGGDNEIIALAYSSENRKVNRSFTGDGTKILALVLVNDSLNAECLGAEIVLRKVE